MHERGSILPLVALVILATGGLVVGLGRLGADAVARARASAAADAAALAGAADGPEAADLLARSNGGRLVDYSVDGTDVEVTVRVGRAEAVARARRVPAPEISARAGTAAPPLGNDGACVATSTPRGGCGMTGIPYTSTRGDGAAPDEHHRSGPRDTGDPTGSRAAAGSPSP